MSRWNKANSFKDSQVTCRFLMQDLKLSFKYALTLSNSPLIEKCRLLHFPNSCMTWSSNFKQLLGEVFVVSRIIKVSVRVISLSLRLRLINPTSTLIILDITKTESNNCFIMHFVLFHWRKATKRANLTWLPLEIIHRGRTLHDYPWPWVSLTWLLYNLHRMTSQALISKIHCTYAIGKEIVSSIFNK